MINKTVLPRSQSSPVFNSKKAMGNNGATGRSKTVWNVLMGVSTIVTCFAALGPFGAWGKAQEVPIGKTFVIAFVLFAIVGHLDMVGKRKEAAKKYFVFPGKVRKKFC